MKKTYLAIAALNFLAAAVTAGALHAVCGSAFVVMALCNGNSDDDE